MVATLFMGVSSLALAVVFHAMRGMYLHAERLLAKAGRQGATRRGVAHPKGKRSAVIFRRKIMGRPLAAAPGQRPQRGLLSLFACASTPHLRAGVAGRTRDCYETQCSEPAHCWCGLRVAAYPASAYSSEPKTSRSLEPLSISLCKLTLCV